MCLISNQENTATKYTYLVPVSNLAVYWAGLILGKA